MSSLRQTIEDTVIDRIEECLGRVRNPESGYLQLVAPFNGNVDETDGPDDIREKLCGRSPAALVFAGGAAVDSEGMSRRRFRRVMSLEVYIASSHYRDKVSRNRPDQAASMSPNKDPGCYQIIEQIQDILLGECFDIKGLGPLLPAREDILIQEKDFTFWRLTYTARVDVFKNPLDYSNVKLTGYSIKGNIGEIDADDPPNPVVESDDDTLQS